MTRTKTIITKEEAFELFGNGYRTSKALGLPPQAVYQWKDGQPIPEVHALRIRYEIKPEHFEKMEESA